MVARAVLVGVGTTPLNPVPAQTALQLMVNALQVALKDADMQVKDLDGIIAVPSLSGPNHFMQAHAVATEVGMVPRKRAIARTVDTGGAGPITALLMAKRMIQDEGCNAVAVVAGDAISSLPRERFLELADAACAAPGRQGDPSALPSPAIPHAYDRVAQWHMKRYGLTRQQLAMCSSLMSLQASRHPEAMVRQPWAVDQVLASPQVAPVTTAKECARRADGGAALVLASDHLFELMQQQQQQRQSSSSSYATSSGYATSSSGGATRSRFVEVLGGGEAAGPLWPPGEITEECFSCAEAAEAAYINAGLGGGYRDIDYFGLYDCFPICLVRAIEGVGLAPPGGGGTYVEQAYTRLMMATSAGDSPPALTARGKDGTGALQQQEQEQQALEPQEMFPVNTHGGLLAFGAPWEAPAMFSVVEAVAQLRGEAWGRQVSGARRALVYGNGGIFSSSAVVILGAPQLDRGGSRCEARASPGGGGSGGPEQLCSKL